MGAAEIVNATLEDQETLVAAFTGMMAVHVIPPLFHPGEDHLVANAVRAAERAGVKRFCYHSVLHAFTPTLRHHMRKASAEALLRDSDLAWTILQPAMYAQTVLRYAHLAEDDVVTVPYSLSTKFTVVDVADVADATVKVLADPGHEYATYELAGPHTLTMTELVSQLASAHRRPLQAHAIPPQAFHINADLTPNAVADVVAMWAEYDRHGLVGNPTALRMLLGREPTTFLRAMVRELSPEPLSSYA